MPLPFLRKIKAIRRRLQWIEFCRKFLKTTAWLAVILLVVLLITRLIVSPYTPERAAIWLGGASVAWLLLWTWIRRVRLFEAALRADETLGLKERLSSAILLRQPRDEAEVAVIEDATRCAEAIRPAKHFPSNLKKELRWAIFPLGTLALAWWLMPQFDLLATREEKKVEVKS
ncbi:hypothetical protein HY256_02570, partial [Candidatus Sumerlaeota bacterium]|nr:hypothetical protein [Candidatus Sumerlaeota bacterium]